MGKQKAIQNLRAGLHE
jgi:hypothetical protein